MYNDSFLLLIKFIHDKWIAVIWLKHLFMKCLGKKFWNENYVHEILSNITYSFFRIFKINEWKNLITFRRSEDYKQCYIILCVYVYAKENFLTKKELYSFLLVVLCMKCIYFYDDILLWKVICCTIPINR